MEWLLILIFIISASFVLYYYFYILPKQKININPIFKENIHTNLLNFYNSNISKSDIPDGLNMCTLNIHDFISINDKISQNDAFEALLSFIEEYKIQIICVQEFNFSYFDKFKERLKELDFKCVIQGSGIVMASKIKPVDTSIKYIGDNRAALFMTFTMNDNSYKICGTHLSIGERYLELQQPKKNITIARNTELRIRQLDKIVTENPDIIMGDFNFNMNDIEYNSLSQKYDSYITEPTTPFDTTVDFIFLKKIRFIKPSCYVINYKYSDHKPVIISF